MMKSKIDWSSLTNFSDYDFVVLDVDVDGRFVVDDDYYYYYCGFHQSDALDDEVSMLLISCYPLLELFCFEKCVCKYGISRNRCQLWSLC